MRWFGGVVLYIGLVLVGCGGDSADPVTDTGNANDTPTVEDTTPPEDTAAPEDTTLPEDTAAPEDTTLPEDTPAPPDDLSTRFAEGVMPPSLHMGGYIDSIFINKAGDRIYFIHSILSPSVLQAQATIEECSHVEATQLPGHSTLPGFEWNTDIYYVEWDGAVWSEPINLGAPINTLAMECCMWLNDDETEIIFNTKSDLDGDGTDQDLELHPTGNYRATRPDRDAPWNTPVPLPGSYGIEDQSESERHDIHKAPTGNLYLWETFDNGDMLLRFGERTGGTYDEPVYAEPTTIAGSVNYETQIWANDAETRLVFNRRQLNGESALYTRTRATIDDQWGDPIQVSTTGFADSTGSSIWGEPTFDQSESYMIFIRFDSTDPVCLTPDIMFSPGTPSDGFDTPTVLN